MKRLTPDQIRQVYYHGPDPVIERLEAQVTELERPVNRTSCNSSQTPSSDGLKNPPTA